MGEELYDLPEGWVWVKLGEVASFKNGINFKSSQKGQEGILTIDVLNMYSKTTAIETKDLYRVNINVKDDYLLKYGDILFVRSSVKREGVGLASLFTPIKEDVTFCGFIIRARLQSLDILPKFTTYYLRTDSAREKIVASSSQVTITNINQDALGNILFTLPPLNEQHRIVTKIEELFAKLDAGVELLNKLKIKLKRYRQAVLKAAVEGDLTKEWREAHQGELEPASELLQRILKQRREKWETDELAKMEAKGKTPKDDKWKQKYKEPVAPDTSDLPELPDGWCWAKLNEVASFKNGINFKSSQKGQLGILTVDVLNMYSNRLAVDTKELYRVDINIKEDYLLEYGDILFVRSSVKREGVGWTSLFIPISEKVTFCGFIIRARLQNLDISPKFITYYLRTDLARAKIVASSSQVTITNISQNALGNILLPIPTVNEQHYIVSKIDQAFTQIDQLEKTIETNLKRSEKLRQSILKQAFTGQLVPQDPNDEPASKLLERIKAEKAQREAQAKPKKKSRTSPKKTPKKASQPKQLELDLDN